MTRDFCSLHCLKPVDLPGEGSTETRFRLVNGDRSFAAAMVYEVDKGLLGKTEEEDPEHVTVDGSKITLVVQSDQWPPALTGPQGTGTLYIDVAGGDPGDFKLHALKRYFTAGIQSGRSPFADPCSPKTFGRFSIKDEPQTATITIRMQEGESDLQVGSHVLHAEQGQVTILVEVDGHTIAGGLAGPPMDSIDRGDTGDTHPHV